MHTVFPHPTLSEMMHESVLDAYGRAIHIYKGVIFFTSSRTESVIRRDA